MKKNSGSLWVLTLLSALFVQACGGGGGGGSTTNAPPSYTGSTNKADISSGNSSSIALGAQAGVQTGSNLSPVMNSTKLMIFAKPKSVARRVQSYSTHRRTYPKKARSSAPNTYYGSCGGTETISFNGTSSDYSGSFTDDNYCDAGTTYNGTMTFTGSTSASGTETVAMSFSSYGVKDATSDGTWDGTATFVQTTGTPTYNITMDYSIVIKDKISGKSNWEKMKDVQTITAATGAYVETFSGQNYDGEVGYVDISTSVPLSYSRSGSNPVAGVVVIIGANNSKLRITYSVTGYLVEADYDNTGSYTTIGSYGYDSTVDVNTSGSTIPGAPTNLTAVDGIGRVTLAWNASPTATSYNIYWDSIPGVTTGSMLIDTVTSEGYVDLYAIDGPNYYAVTAVNAAGESVVSNEALGIPLSGGTATIADLAGTWSFYSQNGYDITAINGTLTIDSSGNYVYSQDNTPSLGISACTETGTSSVSANTMTISVTHGDCGANAGTVFTQTILATSTSLTIVRGQDTDVFTR